MTDNAKAKSGKRKLLIPVLLIVTLVACSVAGYTVWHMMKAPKDAAAAAKPEPPPAPVFFALDTFTVNLINPDNDPDRVLYVGFTLRLPDEETRRRMNDYLPEVRSRLLLLLSRQNATGLANEQGKQQLVTQIKQVLAPPLVQGQPQQVVTDVLFTAFILR
ncbi:flagellar basal body-associated protein FliL [Erwinia aphidicola]|jgi:flagellar FliL protein|uniref:Flagellar protein FliL n=1 Tax=Erwinia aphidicola TaxID=68334 RepID=A0ABU8DJ40_ERWAP|nr:MULTISPECIES: flagellar basal body-associated protein FliL [Erwinia]KMV70166.1 flagellar basal body-associated protein FliL [bacteria symbiont BFo1 of Frankliniella occidentalis]PIJ57379.1 flagellar basal body-associated protein FliL [Erwinia sp. OLMDLW33]KYP84515.1 flagellar basal body-associated protein FliL [bacteria symbiont BFo1 of Frankliniella occidentalis]KYP89685.1 flagellar basal body-associated protein FliL [bacteria symbiont BFo1 of Frankliniella occidentalis]MBD1377250.1 flagel